MSHINLHSVLPEVTENETRAITLFDVVNGISIGQYGFVEFYCSDPDCDCRNVIFQVQSYLDGKSMATI